MNNAQLVVVIIATLLLLVFLPSKLGRKKTPRESVRDEAEIERMKRIVHEFKQNDLPVERHHFQNGSGERSHHDEMG